MGDQPIISRRGVRTSERVPGTGSPGNIATRLAREVQETARIRWEQMTEAEMEAEMQRRAHQLAGLVCDGIDAMDKELHGAKSRGERMRVVRTIFSAYGSLMRTQKERKGGGRGAQGDGPDEGANSSLERVAEETVSGFGGWASQIAEQAREERDSDLQDDCEE